MFLQDLQGPSALEEAHTNFSPPDAIAHTLTGGTGQVTAKVNSLLPSYLRRTLCIDMDIWTCSAGTHSSMQSILSRGSNEGPGAQSSEGLIVCICDEAFPVSRSLNTVHLKNFPSPAPVSNNSLNLSEKS